jgi:hypothetical protein
MAPPRPSQSAMLARHAPRENGSSDRQRGKGETITVARLSHTEATQMLRLIEARRRVIETRELEARVAALEQCIPGSKRKKAA